MKNRGPSPARHVDGSTSLTPARARILEFLQASGLQYSAEDVAAHFGQHVNTARGHLEGLHRSGLVGRSSLAGPGRGRPTWMYRADPAHAEPDQRVREYGALAGALAKHLLRTSSDPERDSVTAGAEWGRDLAATLPPSAAEAGAATAVLHLLADLGFAPRRRPADGVIRLTRCPLLDVARQFPDVVCQVHRGLVMGALDELGESDAAVALGPFGEPDACLLTLAVGGHRTDRSGQT